MTGDNDDGMMLSRRDAIRGGAALGTLALASRIGAYAQVVEAQITEPRIQLGSDYAIHDNGGNLVINHDPNGDILEYDATADQITTLKPLTSVTTEKTNNNHPGGSGWDGDSLERWAGKSVIGDDSAATFLSGESIDVFAMTLVVSQGSSDTVAIIRGSTISENSAIVAQDGGITVETTGSDVTGTTGTDGNVTVSIRTDTIEIENRFGNTARFGVVIEAAAP